MICPPNFQDFEKCIDKCSNLDELIRKSKNSYYKLST